MGPHFSLARAVSRSARAGWRRVGAAGQFLGGREQLAVFAAAAHVGVAVALHQATAVDRFHGQRIVLRREPRDQIQPLLQAGLLDLVAQRGAAEASHAGQRVQHQEAAQRAAAHAAALAQAALDEAAEGLEFSSQRPSPAGRVPQISSRRGCMNSVV